MGATFGFGAGRLIVRGLKANAALDGSFGADAAAASAAFVSSASSSSSSSSLSGLVVPITSAPPGPVTRHACEDKFGKVRR